MTTRPTRVGLVDGARLLVVENDPGCDARRLGDWLTGAGLTLEVLRPYAGDAVPGTVGDRGGLLVLGGPQDAWDAADGTPGASWFGALRALLARSVADGVPVLGVCLGAQLLAQATGGRVARIGDGPELGARLVAKRDAADSDDLFGGVPFTPDVAQWHWDEISVLPPRATLLVAGTRVPNQAFRVGARAWGVQFHPEADAAMVARWAVKDAARVAELGLDGDALVAGVVERLDDLAAVWRPVAERFAAVVGGRQGGRPLPLVAR